MFYNEAGKGVTAFNCFAFKYSYVCTLYLKRAEIERLGRRMDEAFQRFALELNSSTEEPLTSKVNHNIKFLQSLLQVNIQAFMLIPFNNNQHVINKLIILFLIFVGRTGK